jgi:hypothetical protein
MDPYQISAGYSNTVSERPPDGLVSPPAALHIWIILHYIGRIVARAVVVLKKKSSSKPLLDRTLEELFKSG